MPSFEIPDGPTAVPLMSQSVKGKPMRTATVTFTVTNKADQTLSCRLKVAPQADAKDEWFDLQGEKERPFAASETQKVTVNVAVPAEVAPGDFKFRLQAMNVNDPGNDYAESAVATLSVVKPPPPPPTKIWPYILVAAVLVLIVGGVAGFLILSKKPPAATVMVPDVSSGGLTFAQAQGALVVKNFSAVRVTGPATGKAPETVVSQDPAANTAVPPPTASAPTPVKVTVDPGVVVPDVSTKSLPFQQAFDAMNNAGLHVTSPSKIRIGIADRYNVIVDQSLPAGTVVARDTPVTLTVQVPGFCGWACIQGIEGHPVLGVVVHPFPLPPPSH